MNAAMPEKRYDLLPVSGEVSPNANEGRSPSPKRPELVAKYTDSVDETAEVNEVTQLEQKIDEAYVVQSSAEN